MTLVYNQGGKGAYLSSTTSERDIIMSKSLQTQNRVCRWEYFR